MARLDLSCAVRLDDSIAAIDSGDLFEFDSIVDEPSCSFADCRPVLPFGDRYRSRPPQMSRLSAQHALQRREGGLLSPRS